MNNFSGPWHNEAGVLVVYRSGTDRLRGGDGHHAPRSRADLPTARLADRAGRPLARHGPPPHPTHPPTRSAGQVTNKEPR